MISYSFFSLYLLIALHVCALSSPVVTPSRVPGMPTPLCPELRSSGWLLLLEVVTGLLWLSSACRWKTCVSRVLWVAPWSKQGSRGSRTSFYIKSSTWAPYRKGPFTQGECLLGSLHSVWSSVPASGPTGTRADASVGAKPSPPSRWTSLPLSVLQQLTHLGCGCEFPSSLLKLKCSPFFAAQLCIREVGEVYLPAASTCLEGERPALSAPACPASRSLVLCWVTSTRVN